MTAITKQTALDLFNIFKLDPLAVPMHHCVENSPWHGEANVLVHTEMVLIEYLATWSDEEVANFPLPFIEGAIACIFHDTGKPAAKVEKESESRGKYFAFHGHGQISVRICENWLCEQAKLGTLPEGIRFWSILWMIENHQPWDTKDPEKLQYIYRSANEIGYLTFPRMLIGDNRGRITDPKNIEASVATVTSYIHEMANTALFDLQKKRSQPHGTAHFPIAASATGKSSLWSVLLSHSNKAILCYSLDIIRDQLYNNVERNKSYQEIWQESVDDPTFKQTAWNMFTEFVKKAEEAECDVYIDNCNLTKKSRRQYLDYLKRRGWDCHAHTLPISRADLSFRQMNRGDKVVGTNVSQGHYHVLQQPSYHEFDDIKEYVQL